MFFRWLRRVAVPGALLAALGISVIPAEAAPAVRIVYSHAKYHLTYHEPGTEILHLSVVGPGDAWAIAARVNAAADQTSGLLEHYNGHQWAPASYPGERTFIPESIEALSASDIWLFGYKDGSGFALHFLKGVWNDFALPADTSGAWLVLSDKDIWVAAGPLQIPGCYSHATGPGCSAAAHWNGSTWQYYRVGVSNLTSIAGTAATGIWAAGYNGVNTKSPDWLQPLVFRLTGPTFKRMGLDARRTNYVPELTVLSRRSVWLGGTTPRRAPNTCVTHWNGQRWSAFSTGQTGYLGLCDNLLGDGRAGVWFAPEVHWTGTKFIQFSSPPNLPANGGLSEYVAPVPGRRGLQWVYGYVEHNKHGAYQITGYIYKRG